MNCIFVLYDESKIQLEKVSLFKLSYKNEKIVEKSIELYSEPDPCIIYSTYCANYLALELEKKLRKEFEESVSFEIQDLPSFIKEVIAFNEKVKFIEII